MSDRSHVVEVLRDLVALPSVNPEGDPEKLGERYGEQRVAEYVAQYFADLDVEVSRQEVLPGQQNVLVLAPGRREGRAPVCLEAHMDTVDVEGMQDPFVPRLESGRVHGRGSCDTKASLAVMMVALREVVATGRAPACGVLLAATVDEERGHSGVLKLLERGALAAAVVGEPTGLEVVPAHKGQAYFEIRARGKAAHTSTPHHGVNAISTMAEVIRCVQRRSMAVFGERPHPLCGPSALTVSIIEGGSSEHVVPDLCRIRLDLRLIPGLGPDEVMAQVRAWISEDLGGAAAATVDVIPPYKSSPALDTPPDHPLVHGLAFATRAVLGDAKVMGVPYNTDGGYLSRAGVPAVVFGPGHIAQAHAAEEYVAVAEVEAAVRILAQFLTEWDRDTRAPGSPTPSGPR